MGYYVNMEWRFERRFERRFGLGMGSVIPL